MEIVDKTYKELTKKRLDNVSMLQMFNILKEDNDYFLNIFNSYKITDDIKENENVISYFYLPNEEWWENIADMQYENEKLWWVIAMSNDVLNPFEEMENGDSIKIIDSKLLYSIISDIKSLSDI